MWTELQDPAGWSCPPSQWVPQPRVRAPDLPTPDLHLHKIPGEPGDLTMRQESLIGRTVSSLVDAMLGGSAAGGRKSKTPASLQVLAAERKGHGSQAQGPKIPPPPLGSLYRWACCGPGSGGGRTALHTQREGLLPPSQCKAEPACALSLFFLP